jgi:predicted RNA-binding Zn-ribbon protein involved in translation (DUF1610 family)
MNNPPCCTACDSPMRALEDAPVEGLHSFKCPHCRRIQRADDAGEGYLSPSVVDPGQS